MLTNILGLASILGVIVVQLIKKKYVKKEEKESENVIQIGLKLI